MINLMKVSFEIPVEILIKKTETKYVGMFLEEYNDFIKISNTYIFRKYKFKNKKEWRYKGYNTSIRKKTIFSLNIIDNFKEYLEKNKMEN